MVPMFATHVRVMMMTGPHGMLGYWKETAPRSRFEPRLSPQGDFSGRVENKPAKAACNDNHLPADAAEEAANQFAAQVISLVRLTAV